ncbi:MAG: hypothetical protein J5805_07705 [Bacteroidaceae bacterium]|nr:hypothetical protein [Bacteroidaceae bacterium]
MQNIYKLWMIQIDKLSFDFVVPQEESAKRLYSNWDSFCHQCFVQVAEEYFNAYDNDDVIYEFERIDLDLGVITEENIYEEYPKRLREQLMKINPSSIRKCADKNEELNPNSHIVNFIYFLRYGCLRTDSIIDFNNEIEWLNNLSDTEIDTCVKEIVGIVRINDSFFYRLTSYITNTTFLHRLFQTVISMPEYGIKERRRFFILFLELRKDIIVGFIHKTSDFAILNNLSELLDCNSVKMIMSEETALFATAGIASFWHSFYVWMIQSYPYDETEMYGDKSQFIRHIHRQLLMFVRSGNRFSYFSKDELVSQFLKSVFGADKYIYMIDVIYRRLSDTSGKISAQNYQLQELYMVFVRLSMMNSLSFSSKNIPTNVQSKHTFTSYLSMINRLTDFLRNENINDSDKQILVKQIVDDYPELFVKWLHENSRDLQNIMQYFTGIFNEYHIYRLLASISVSLIEWTKDLKNSIKNTQRYFTWLNNVSDERLEQLFCKSILLWIADDSCYSEHRFKRLINLIYHQITGNNALSIKEFQSLQEKLSMILSESEIINDSTVINHNDSTEINHDRLKMILLSSEVSDTVKRRESALFWSNHSRDYSEAITILHHYGILSLVVRHTNSNALREIIHGLSVHSFGTSSVSLLQRIYDWLESHDVYVISHVIIAEAEIIPQFLLWISESKSKDVALTKEVLLSLFALFFGKSDAESSLRYFVEEIAKDNEQSLLSELHVYEHIEHNKETVKGRLSRLSDDDIARLESVFLSSEASNAVKRRETALFWSNHSEDYSEAITILHQSGLLSLVVRHTNSNALREIIHGLSVHSFGTSSVSLLHRIYDWLESHDDYVNSHVIIAETDRIPQFLLWISESKSKDVTLTREILLSLFAMLFGKSDAESSLRYFVKEIAKGNEQSLLFELKSYEETGVTDSDKANITSLDNLVESGVSEIFKIRLLHYYLHNSPRQLLEYIRSTVKQGILLERQWCEWIDTNELRDLACGISISVTDLFIQIVDILQIDKETERKVWVAYFVRYNNDDWFYNTSEENIEQFVDEFYIIQGKNDDEILTEKKQLIQNIKETLNIVLLDNPTEDLTNEQIVNNAGLCLLAPWFVRLFDMLGYLDSVHKKLKNTSSKIRAVFLLQYLVYGEERKYEEYELIFNRLLTDLPQYIPIPKCLNLTDEERQIADGMISGVKANWENMKGTSDSGFRKSFISRNGVLEQKDEYWMLTINEKAYDILLETIPWAFRQIRLPWLKKMIQVSWHDKQII